MLQTFSHFQSYACLISGKFRRNLDLCYLILLRRFFTATITDDLNLFWFSRKIAHAHISGRQNKKKLKEKNVESSDHLVNKVLTSLYNSFISVDFGKNMPECCTTFGCINSRSTTSLQYYRIPSAKWYPEQRITKWVNAKIDRLRKYITHVCSPHFATDKTL